MRKSGGSLIFCRVIQGLEQLINCISEGSLIFFIFLYICIQWALNKLVRTYCHLRDKVDNNHDDLDDVENAQDDDE